jgi:hypothetical protein
MKSTRLSPCGGNGSGSSKADAGSGKKRLREKGTAAEKPATTTKVLNVTGARLSITWQKKTVRTSDVIRVLEEALAQLRGHAENDAA